MQNDVAGLKDLTQQPGVYKMLDAKGDVLYVGKALNLQKRVSSYFSKTLDSVKTRALVAQIASVDVTVTRTETEALILESSWIKLYRPKYNILMRDDKSYPFIYMSNHPTFPSIGVVRHKKKPSTGHYFGPYPSTTAVRQTMTMIHKLFKIRNCSDVYFNARSRPCLQYQIKRCSAPCVAKITSHAYQEAIRDAKHFLQGKNQEIIVEIERRIQVAVAQLAFEEAASLRDQMKYLRTVQEQQHVLQSAEDADIVVLKAEPGFALVQWVQIRHGEIMSLQHFSPAVPPEGLEYSEDEDALWQNVFAAFLTQFYFDMPARIPRRIITDRKVSTQGLLEEALTMLSGKPCRITTGQRALAARWLAFAHDNLQQAIAQYHTTRQTIHTRMQALAAFLRSLRPITRMDCFDVSHFQGDATVASCVVFDANGPCKRAYRRFNIKGITPGDDYAALEQALRRRYQGVDTIMPDVLIIDGGAGQVAVAQRVLASLQRSEPIILGVAKGPSRKSGHETLLLAGKPQVLAEASPARHLIQYIRDEAHRFAITAHRKQRDKTSLYGTLETIPGIGPKKRKALIQRFGGLRELAKAPVTELTKVPGISQHLAALVYGYFHP